MALCLYYNNYKQYRSKTPTDVVNIFVMGQASTLPHPVHITLRNVFVFVLRINWITEPTVRYNINMNEWMKAEWIDVLSHHLEGPYRFSPVRQYIDASINPSKKKKKKKKKKRQCFVSRKSNTIWPTFTKPYRNAFATAACSIYIYRAMALL